MRHSVDARTAPELGTQSRPSSGGGCIDVSRIGKKSQLRETGGKEKGRKRGKGLRTRNESTGEDNNDGYKRNMECTSLSVLRGTT